MMSIAQFAARTGMVPSALRFYESKGILVPAERHDNGYRFYGYHQIQTAKLVNSLRQSGISLGDIRCFLEAEESTRFQLLERWRREAEARLLSVQIASQYLNGMESDHGSLHLINWEEPLTVIWQPFLVDKPVSSYSREMKQAAAKLRDLNIRTQGSSLIKVIDSLPHAVQIEVGYQVITESSRKPTPLPTSSEAYLETIPPTLFISVDSSWEDTFICMRTIRFLQKFGFEPAGKRLERHFPDSPIFEIMIPVMQTRFT